MHFMFIFM